MFYRQLVAAVLCVLSIPGRAWAMPNLLVLQAEEQQPRPSLQEALRVQLRDTAEVIAVDVPLASEPAAVRIGQANDITSRAHARFAVWLEAAPELDGGPGFLLYVVGGGDSGRAVIEVLRLPNVSEGPDVDRTLALKVSEIVESALEIHVVKLNRSLAPAQPSAPVAQAASDPRKAAPAPGKGPLELILGGLVWSSSRDSNAQAGIWLGLGRLFDSGSVQFELGVSGQLLSSLSMRDGNDEVRIAEQGGLASFGMWTRGSARVGLRLDGGLRWLHAEGFRDGAPTRNAALVAPVIRLGPAMRFELSQQLAIALGAGGEWLPVRERFSLGGGALTELGHWRAGAAISLVVSLY